MLATRWVREDREWQKYQGDNNLAKRTWLANSQSLAVITASRQKDIDDMNKMIEQLDPHNQILEIEPTNLSYKTNCLPHTLVRSLQIDRQRGNVKQMVTSSGNSNQHQIFVNVDVEAYDFIKLCYDYTNETKSFLINLKVEGLEEYAVVEQYIAYTNQHYSDIVEPKRISIQLPEIPGIRVIIGFCIGNYMIQHLEAVYNSKAGRWTVPVAGYSWSPSTIPFARFWLRLIILAKADSSPTLPETVAGSLRSLNYYATAELRLLLAHLETPLEFNSNDRLCARSYQGGLIGGHSHKSLSNYAALLALVEHRPQYNIVIAGSSIPLCNQSRIETYNPIDLCEMQIVVPFSLPGMPDSQFLLEVDRSTGETSELELALCNGDFELVKKLIIQMQNSASLTSSV